MCHAPAPIEWVSALLKLGRKYQVGFIADEAIRRLRHACPNVNDPHCKFLDRTTTIITDYVQGGEGMAITIVNLARSFDLPELLPVAMYRCCQMSTHTLIHGATLEDGTHEQLSNADVALCLEGKTQILEWNLSLLPGLRISQHGHSCGECFERILFSTKALLDYDICFNKFLSFADDEPCDDCKVELAKEVRIVQREAYRELKNIFAL